MLNVNVSRKALVSELCFLQSGLEKKATIPILSHVRIEALPDNKLVLDSTDLNSYLTCTIDAKVEDPGLCLIPLAKLLALLNSFTVSDGDDLSIKIDPDDGFTTHLKCGKAKTRFLRTQGDFPERPVIGDGGVEITASVMRVLINNVKFIIPGLSEEREAYIRSGLLEFDGGKISFSGTDRKRFITTEFISNTNDYGEYFYKSIPKQTIDIFARLIEKETIKPVIISESNNRNHIVIQFDNKTIFTLVASNQKFTSGRKLLPDYRNCPDFLRAVVKVEDLINSINRANILATQNEDTDKTKFNNLELRFSEDSIDIISQNQFGDHVDPVKVLDFQGQAVAYKFNANYLLEFLRTLTAQNIELFIPFRDPVQVEINKPVIPHCCIALPISSGAYSTEYIFNRLKLA